MLKKRIIPTLLFNNLKLVKGINFKSWRTTGSIMQAVRIYNIREVDELILLDIAATNSKKKVDFCRDFFYIYGTCPNRKNQLRRNIENIITYE